MLKRKQWLFRGGFYLLGMGILALGLTLNTKTGFGASAVISIPYTLSVLYGPDLGNTTFVMYVLFVGVQLLLHRKAGRGVLLKDLLQIPVSLLFTRAINWVGAALGAVNAGLPGRIGMLAAAVVCTGVGAAMTLNMRLAPNPTDGLLQALSDALGKKTGNMKNLLDLSCVAISLLLGLAARDPLAGVGAGTVAAAIGVGRVMALFNRLCKDKMGRLAGVN